MKLVDCEESIICVFTGVCGSLEQKIQTSVDQGYRAVNFESSETCFGFSGTRNTNIGRSRVPSSERFGSFTARYLEIDETMSHEEQLPTEGR